MLENLDSTSEYLDPEESMLRIIDTVGLNLCKKRALEIEWQSFESSY